MDPRGVFSVSIVCLVIAFAVASDAGTGLEKEAGSRAQETTVRAAPAAGYWGVRTTTASSHGDQVGRGHAPRPQGERERVEPSESGRQEEEEEVDYEGVEEAEDEYEDELKAVAESHEAMSRDDTKNSDVSTAAGAEVLDEGPTAAKNFDSHEVITVNESDEDVASNEAITDEQVDKYDPEVAELLKYKKKRKSSSLEGSRAKTKRVPTVKKELSTQREILIGSNETQVPKSLVLPEDTPNRLNEEPEAVQRRNVETNESIKSEDPGFSERSSGEGEVPVDNRYSGSDSKSPKKLDKRQETDLARLKSLLAEYASEEEQRQKVRDSGTEKYVQGENVLKLLENLVEYVSRLERQQKLILYVQNKFAELKTGTVQEPTKTGYQSSSTPFPGTSGSPNDSRKSRKKLKKKKKKPRHRYPTTTLTPDPLPVFVSEGKPGLMQKLDDFENQRLVRFGNVAARQPVPAQGHREFTSVYDRPADPERIAEYDVAEAYRNQLSPMSREFLRRQEDDYQGDFGMQGEGFVHGQGYEPGRDFSLSKSWPDISYKYSPPWKSEERPLVPIPSEKWPWRRPQNDVKYWQQRGKLLPVEKSYWSPMSKEEDAGEEAEKLWQQQRAQHSWDRPRSSWPLEKPALKLPASWQQPERPVKLYDSEQANRSNVWEKSRFELNRPTKQEAKEKIILPQITMKTWNSLTSDPATWPHKLPGAKPWPKDENGKSYNPNADLVKKLGLDKQSNAAAKQEAEKPSAERKSKDDKQSRLFTGKESSKEEEFPQAASEYKPDGDRSDSSDYKGKNSESMKPWAMLAVSKAAKEWAKPENTQGDDGTAWRRKYEGKSSWSNDTALPEIQSVGAWVMSSDQSTWKPYQIKPMEPSGDSASRRWPRPISKPSTDTKWSNKGFWAEKVNDAWMNHTNAGSWPEKPNAAEIWPGKASKPGSWFAKVKQTDGWTGKSSNPDSWKAKEGEWMSNSENSWSAKGGSRSTKGNEPWASKSNDEASKLNAEWPAKAKEEDSWKPTGDGWPRKSSDQAWSSKSNELSPWQQKMNEEWSYGKASSTGTWPSKWKQFAYHRVTALPISKPGTTADVGSSKSKNAFVAVSAVSSPRYTGNDWRKNEEEARNDSTRSDDQERSTGQLQVGLERPIYAWKKDPDPRTPSAKGNASDPLENELEALRQIDFWFYKENETEKRSTTTNASAETTTAAPARSASTTAAQRRSGNAAGSNGPLETNRRTISMK